MAPAIILARGGSKGAPGKNVAPLAGRPCIAWSIEHAFKSTGIERVMVSTDDRAIAQAAWNAGAEVAWRPAELANDAARIDDAARHAARALEEGDTLRGPDAPGLGAMPLAPDAPIVVLYGNVPVRPEGLIDRALETIARTNADSVQSYARVGKHHPWWQARVDERSGEVRPWEGEALNHGVYRRQDLPPAFIPDGGVLVVRRRALFLDIPGVPEGPHAFFGLDRRGVVTGDGEVIDIDTPIDLLLAHAVLRGAR